MATDNLNDVPYKDINFLSKFELIKIDEIKNKEISKYIYSLILNYNYNDNLMMVNWNKFNLKKLNFYECEKILFFLNVYLNLSHNCCNKIHLNDLINKINNYLNIIKNI